MITRALLEHYLRLRDWSSEGNVFVHRSGRRYAMDEGEDLFHVALYLVSERPKDIAFRLGLCAAAEDDLAELATGMSERRDDALRESARRHLEAASVDPEAWEKARRP